MYDFLLSKVVKTTIVIHLCLTDLFSGVARFSNVAETRYCYCCSGTFLHATILFWQLPTLLDQTFKYHKNDLSSLTRKTHNKNKLNEYIRHTHTHMHSVFVQPVLLWSYFTLAWSTKKLTGIVAAELLQARCHSCHPTNSVKALKDDNWLYITYVLV